jgi:hypothetical protein
MWLHLLLRFEHSFAFVRDLVPSRRHQFDGTLVIRIGELCRKCSAILGKLSVFCDSFHECSLVEKIVVAAIMFATQVDLKLSFREIMSGNEATSLLCAP